MWVLDPGNSDELLERLRPHSASSEFDWSGVLWCGEGWRALVGACHEELSATFPSYRFRSIRQEQGALVFEAVPKDEEAIAEESEMLREITERYRVASTTVCEWCGRSGTLRTAFPESYVLTDLSSPQGNDERRPHTFKSGMQPTPLCDGCAEDIKTTPWPLRGPVV